MAFIRTSFDWAGNLYVSWFSEWFHVHFLIRTVIILLLLWLMIYIIVQLFHYVIAPIFLLFYYNVLFRFWNFLFVETPQEWIYIHYHSKDKPDFNDTYFRLCDKTRRNRLILSHSRYVDIISKTRKVATRLLAMFCVIATLWAMSFGLHYEYAVPAWGGQNSNITDDNHTTTPPAAVIPTPIPTATPTTETNINDFIDEDETGNEDIEDIPNDIEYGYLNPANIPPYINVFFMLNESGSSGARLRDAPSISQSTIIEIVWLDAVLEYLHQFVQDEDVRGLYWLRVVSPSGTEGYISSQLVYIV